MGTVMFLKCWSYEVIRSNLINKRRISPSKASELCDKYFNEELFGWYLNNLDKIPPKVTTFCLKISRKASNQ